MNLPAILAGGGPLPGFLRPVAGPVDRYGYAAIAVLILLENVGVPVVPGETALIAGAIFAGAGRAGLNVVVVGVVAALCAFAGSEAGYAIGRWGGRALVLRYGRFVLVREHHVGRAEAVVGRYGGVIVVVARFVVGLRELNGIIAGVTGMGWLRFAVYNALGAVAWVGAWVSAGYLAGDHIEAVYREVTRYSVYVLVTVAVLLAGYLVARLARRRRAAAAEGGPPPRPLSPGAAAGHAPGKAGGRACTACRVRRPAQRREGLEGRVAADRPPLAHRLRPDPQRRPPADSSCRPRTPARSGSAAPGLRRLGPPRPGCGAARAPPPMWSWPPR